MSRIGTIVLSLMFFCLPVLSQSQTVSAAQINGTWEEMNNYPEGVSATITIKSLGGGKLQVTFLASNSLRKVGNQVKGTVILKGSTAIFKPATAQINKQKPCTITLKFVDGTLMVTEKGECGWGAGITAEGIYNKEIKE
jgi:hypothetical protein